MTLYSLKQEDGTNPSSMSQDIQCLKEEEEEDRDQEQVLEEGQEQVPMEEHDQRLKSASL